MPRVDNDSGAGRIVEDLLRREWLRLRSPDGVASQMSGVDAIAAELADLSKQVTGMTRNFPIADVEAMKSGDPREGAGELEKLIRTKYLRMKELESAFNAAH